MDDDRIIIRAHQPGNSYTAIQPFRHGIIKCDFNPFLIAYILWYTFIPDLVEFAIHIDAFNNESTSLI